MCVVYCVLLFDVFAAVIFMVLCLHSLLLFIVVVGDVDAGVIVGAVDAVICVAMVVPIASIIIVGLSLQSTTIKTKSNNASQHKTINKHSNTHTSNNDTQ